MIRNLLARCYQRIPVIRELGHIRGFLSQIQKDIYKLNNIQIMRFLEIDLKDHPRYSDPKRLLRYAFQVCSQNGEDGIIHEIFNRIGTTNQTFVEIGVGDGCENNTAFLLSLGWKGFWIDGDSSLLKTINKRRDIAEGSIHGLVSFVTRENISASLEQLNVPKDFDLLSLDVDQNTYYIWEGLRSYRPRIVVVEYNASIPPDINWKAHYNPNRLWDGAHNFGASLKAFELLSQQLGYSLVGCEFIGANAFFVRNDLVGDRFAEPFTSENHYEPPRYALKHRRGHSATILDRINAD